MPRIFITGITGLVGGDYLHIISQRHRELQIIALIRDPSKAQVVQQHYPFVEIILGTLDDIGVSEDESEKANVVLNFANCDHLPAANAIIRGQPQTWGEYIPHPYDDWHGVRKLTAVPSPGTEEDDCLPDWAAHRDVDMTILNGYRSYPGIVRTAIVCPPTVYGPSRFPLPTRSIQLPRLLHVFLRRRRAFTIKNNENMWNMIHTQDISEMYVLLTEAAVDQDQRPGDLWDECGYYFSEQGNFVWGDIIRKIAKLGHQKGFFDSSEPENLTNDDVSRFLGGGQMNVCSTSLGSAKRACKLLGWEPQPRSIFEDLERTLDFEAKLLGIV
ncbi:hypothetical protein N7490_002276 [Penicillium lividum]|nr:hypothetical protein N7490_002276 [Penicillium lividum]